MFANAYEGAFFGALVMTLASWLLDGTFPALWAYGALFGTAWAVETICHKLMGK